MAVLRSEIPVSYKTTLNRTIVNALRDVFVANYPDSDFQNLNIVNAFPNTETEYPAIVCKFQEGRIMNAGVGHVELFPGPDGGLRKWNHRRFEGTFEFTITALSPLDRDVLSDAFIEVLSFGRLEALENAFFNRIYGAPGVNPGVLGLLSQMTLNTDDIEATGESNTIAPWQPEDTMVFSNSYFVTCHGGFYNTPGNIVGPIQNKTIQVTIDIPLKDKDPENQWSFVFDYDDVGYVTGQAVIPAKGGVYDDAGTAGGTAVIGTSDTYIP